MTIKNSISLLITDDETDIRNSLRDYFSSYYPKVYIAENGEEALKIISQNPVDITIIDINMPGMSGIELLKNIHENHPTTLNIILTGFGDKNHAIDAIKCQVADFIEKPVKVEVLHEAIEKAIERKNRSNQANSEKENLILNIEKNIKPIVKKLKTNQALSDVDIKLLDEYMDNISSSFSKNLLKNNLSSTEIKISELIKNGLSSKEISKILNISILTAKTHAKNIRRKLGLKNKKLNLRTHLYNLTK